MMTKSFLGHKPRKDFKSFFMHSGKRNRIAGHNFEREVVLFFKAHGYPKAVTARNESRTTDAQKIDICKIPFHVQCKNYSTSINHLELLNEMPKDKIRFVFHKKTVKKRARFYTLGKTVTLTLEDFGIILDSLSKITGKLHQF